MNTTPFHVFWNKHYPESVPLGHLLRADYPARWFRIHSLPESKRYADNEDEWKILLYRQNMLITDLLGIDAEFYLVTGRYCFLNPEFVQIDTEYHELDCFRKLGLQESEAINLAARYPEHYDEEDGIHFVPAAVILTWRPGTLDDLLMKIADDEAEAVFLSMTQKVAVCPYDGGVDCIVEASDQVDYYKNKYRNWLSRLESSL